MKKIKRILSMALIVIGLTLSVTSNSEAKDYVSCHNSTSTVYSNNIHGHVYSSNAQVSNSYMCANPDGSLSRVENFGDVILVEKYNSNYQLTMQGTVKFELTKFGGFFSGANYNYLVFGQDNPNEKKDVEVLRIVRYSKDWQRIDQASLYDCNTREIFSTCNTSFCEYNGLLYIRMGHKSYKDSSSVIHQSVMTVCYNNTSHSIVSKFDGVNGPYWGSIENIGASYIEANAGKISFVDQSLTSPYCVLISKYNNGAIYNTMAGGSSFLACLGARGALTSSIPEFTIGGITSSPQQYIVVGNSVPMDGSSSNKNVFIATVPKSGFTYDNLKISYLTGYAHGDTNTTTTPFIVKINDNRYAVLWEERYGYSDYGRVNYVYIDGYGNRLCDTESIAGCLSDCQPVVYGNEIVWYTTNGVSVKIYSIPATTENTTNNTYSNNTTVNNNDFSKIYDYNYYMSNYPDIRVLYSNNPNGALQHFITVGMAEGRQASPNFNLKIYMNNYPDLKAVYADNYASYYIHYMNVGYAEGRNAVTAIK